MIKAPKAIEKSASKTNLKSSSKVTTKKTIKLSSRKSSKPKEPKKEAKDVPTPLFDLENNQFALDISMSEGIYEPQ